MSNAHAATRAPLAAARYLCSHLVSLAVLEGPQQWVNLEEIWESGAMLDCEQEIRPGAAVKLAADASGYVSFAGRVTSVERYELGWKAEIAFSPATPWSRDLWTPDHIFDPAKLGGKPQ